MSGGGQPQEQGADSSASVRRMVFALASCGADIDCVLACSVYELKYFNIADNDADEEE